jgi:hypothetical protein
MVNGQRISTTIGTASKAGATLKRATAGRLVLANPARPEDGWTLVHPREAGLTDAELADIVALVALNVFTSYFDLGNGSPARAWGQPYVDERN